LALHIIRERFTIVPWPLVHKLYLFWKLAKFSQKKDFSQRFLFIYFCAGVEKGNGRIFLGIFRNILFFGTGIFKIN
jgi:hypothetical protein